MSGGLHVRGRPALILYVYSGKARPGGIGLDFVVRQQLTALTDAGCKVIFVARGSFKHPNVKNISFPLTPAHLLSWLSSKYYYTAQHRFFSEAGAWIARFGKVDLAISWTRQSRNLFRVCSARNIPAVLNCPGWHYNYPLGNDAWTTRPWPAIKKADLDEEYSRATMLLTASEFARKTFLANQFAEARVVNIGRGADSARFTNPERPFSPFRLAFFAQVSERKGIFEAIAAWKQAAIPGGEFWVIGAVPKELDEALKNAGAPGIRFFGFRSDPETLLQQCHVQILPSRQEGMAKSLVEGAACGLVTLATEQSGFPLVEGETGYYIERENTAQVAQYLRALAADAQAWQAMSHKSSAYVKQNLTWPKFRQQFVAALARILEKS